MADNSGISWTDATWNPVVGCSLVSPGCTNCYAMKQAARIVAMQPGSHYQGTVREVNGNAVWTGTVNQAPDKTWEAPLRWKKPRRIFVNSMGDLFHESVPEAWIDRAFAVMALCPQHTFQLLTKRAPRMREYGTHSAMSRIWEQADIIACAKRLPEGHRSEAFLYAGRDGNAWPLPNVWLGVSAEDQARADERIPDLLATPAAVHFVSAEPLLGPIQFNAINVNESLPWHSLNFGFYETPGHLRPRLDWIIGGGESGPGFRPMQIEWAESIREQCKAAGTAYFFKQDSGPRSGMQGRATPELWAAKEFPSHASKPTPPETVTVRDGMPLAEIRKLK